MSFVAVEHMSNYLAVRIALDMHRATTSNAGIQWTITVSCYIYIVIMLTVWRHIDFHLICNVLV